MRIVSPFLKRVLYPSLSTVGLLRHTAGGGLAVLTYHGVVPQGYMVVDPALDGNLVTAETLRQQLHLLKAHYNMIAPEEALAWLRGQGALPPRAVLLTCDDGLLNCLTEMLPILQSEKLKCLFFVTGASASEARATLWYEELFLLFMHVPAGNFRISGEGVAIEGELGPQHNRRKVWWDAVMQLSQLGSEARNAVMRIAREQFGINKLGELARKETTSCRRFGLLTVAEIKELAAAGMTIGAHTLSHPMLSQMPADLMHEEISGSKARLEAVLQKEVWAFAYPFGNPESVTPAVLSATRKAGFAAAFLNYGGGLGADLPAYALPRVHVTAGMSLGEFEAHISGLHVRLERYKRRYAHAMELTAELDGVQ